MNDLTAEEIETITIACDAVKQEMEAADAAGLELPEGTYFKKFRQQFPEATTAIDRFLDGRTEAAKRIDPRTCQYFTTYVDILDPYGIWENTQWCAGRDMFVRDDQTNECVHTHDLSDEQWSILRERIDREHPPVPSPSSKLPVPRPSPNFGSDLAERIRARMRGDEAIDFEEYVSDWLPPEGVV